MAYDLYLGDYTYSSWSLRAFLLFHRFGIPHNRHMIWFSGDASVADMLAAHGVTAKTVPTLATSDGAIIGDSLAIAEELNSREPGAGLWPSDPKARALARGLAAEMHSSYAALRSHCPMDLRRAYSGYKPPAEVLQDVARIEEIWANARSTFASDTPWLCGSYSVADAFFAPVAARIASYDLPVGAAARAYVDAHLADPAFRAWRAMGLVRGDDLPWYANTLPTRPWPGPEPRAAKAVESGPSLNDLCPYSKKPVNDFMELGGRVWGFCNPFCRDKTVADPDAWTAFTKMEAEQTEQHPSRA